jgi:hypothetical protein
MAIKWDIVQYLLYSSKYALSWSGGNLYPVEISTVEQSICGEVGKHADLDTRNSL